MKWNIKSVTHQSLILTKRALVFRHAITQCPVTVEQRHLMRFFTIVIMVSEDDVTLDHDNRWLSWIATCKVSFRLKNGSITPIEWWRRWRSSYCKLTYVTVSVHCSAELLTAWFLEISSNCLLFLGVANRNQISTLANCRFTDTHCCFPIHALRHQFVPLYG